MGRTLRIVGLLFLFQILFSETNNMPAAEFVIESTSNYTTDQEAIMKIPRAVDNGYPTVWSDKLLPLQSTCGRTTAVHDRTVGGSPAELGAWPWLVALGFRNVNRPKRALQWYCAGALITDRYVVTAAHCIIDTGVLNLTTVRLGELDIDHNVNDGADPIDVAIARYITHEQYSAKHFSNDIALLKLEHPVTFNNLIQPICLPIMSKHRLNSFAQTNPFIAGWGSLSFHEPLGTALMEVQVPVLENDVCEELYKNLNTTNRKIDDRVMCAGFITGGDDACRGDSGGPLMWPHGHQYYLIGIVSYGYKCGKPGYPGVYHRVTHYLDWIVEKLNDS